MQNVQTYYAVAHTDTDSRKFTEYMDMTMNKLSIGGAGLYIRANLNCSIREDLNILEDEFECIWVEIK